MSILQIHRLNGTVEDHAIKVAKTNASNMITLDKSVFLFSDSFTSIELQFDRSVDEQPKLIKRLFNKDVLTETTELNIVKFSILHLNKSTIFSLLHQPDTENDYSLSMTPNIHLNNDVKIDKLVIIK